MQDAKAKRSAEGSWQPESLKGSRKPAKAAAPKRKGRPTQGDAAMSNPSFITKFGDGVETRMTDYQESSSGGR